MERTSKPGILLLLQDEPQPQKASLRDPSYRPPEKTQEAQKGLEQKTAP